MYICTSFVSLSSPSLSMSVIESAPVSRAGVSHLSRCPNAFKETKINKDPCKKQAQDDLPAHVTHLRDAAC